MLMVVFGAGASFDSVNLSQHPNIDPAYRPPLANDLFHSRFDDMFHGLRSELVPILNMLRSLPNDRPVERVLQELEERAAGYPRRRGQLMAVRFYLRLLLRSCGDVYAEGADHATNYVALFDSIAEWQHHTGEEVAIVTFNYDLMVEYALGAVVDMTFGTTRAWMTGPGIRVFKLHGSVNWAHPAHIPGHQGDMQIADVCRAANGETLDVDGRIFEVSDTVGSASTSVTTHVPALAIPVVSKSGFECPSDHLDELKTVLPRVDRILVVGWRATETDFVRLWQELVPMESVIRTFVNAESVEAANATIANLDSTGIVQRTTAPLGGGFTDLVRGSTVWDFLMARPD